MVSKCTGEMVLMRIMSRSNPNGLSRNEDSSLEAANGVAPKRGMVLPFTPYAMSFDNVNYYVDMPAVRNPICSSICSAPPNLDL